MIDHYAIQLAARARLMGLVVCTSGATTLGASAKTFTRSAGSFLDDGFSGGMEVHGVGFSSANNEPAVIERVEALALTVTRNLSDQSAAADRQLVVSLPSQRRWENKELKPTAGVPYVREQYIPGPSNQRGAGEGGMLELWPMYAVHVCVPEDTGMGAPARYADAVLNLFPHRLAIPVGADTLRVRTDTGPYSGQKMPGEPGWTTIPVTIPFRLMTANSI